MDRASFHVLERPSHFLPNIEIAATIDARKKKIMSFFNFLHGTNSKIARSQAVCVNTSQRWGVSDSFSFHHIKIAVRGQALPHPQFVFEKVCSRVLQCLRGYCKSLSLIIHHDCGKLQKYLFLRTAKILTVSLHRRIVVEIESCNR